jgi:hypothetical protein
VYLGDGKGNFTLTQEYALNHPHSVAVKDLNGDGKLDIVVASDHSNTQPSDLTILWGQGKGVFVQGPSYVLPPGAYEVKTVTLNHHPDIAVTTLGGVNVFLGDGTGYFAPPQFYPTGFGDNTDQATGVVQLGQGLVVGNFYSETVSVLAGNGSGKLAPAVNYSVGATVTGPTDVAIGSWGGHRTIVTANLRSETVSILTVLPHHKLSAPTTLAVDGAPAYVAIGRFGSGALDIAVSDQSSNEVSILSPLPG